MVIKWNTTQQKKKKEKTTDTCNTNESQTKKNAA